MGSNETHLTDYVALTQLKHEYCHLIDGGDYEEWVALFTDDGAFGFAGEDPFEGTAGLTEFAEEVFDENYGYSAHFVANPVIEIDGDEATGNWYFCLLFETADGDLGWSQARYEDEFRRVDGEWRIVSVTIHPGRREHF